MAVGDTFPLDPTFGYQLANEENILRGRIEAGKQFQREKAAPRRMWALTFAEAIKTERDSIQNFLRAMRGDFFTYHHKELGRKFSVIQRGELAEQRLGNDRYDLQCQVIEQPGAAMTEYPDFSGPFPFVSVSVDGAAAVSGRLWIYAGYGARVTGPIGGDVYFDGAIMPSNPYTAVPLGMHRVRVEGLPGGLGLDYLI